ncbi:NAD(P)-dependent oxidoreductase [Nitrogeniibacter mangrovi]|uniref:NAD(P)-dependent oxidoreductase n=1 Tax=Nitrogeniibacter mangrovi TaxID=2016596 RepID=A0A6C1B9Q6_9RHOO|nr:NAD(P)-dependent oxidoreductase [Nitrogeniibacter mangrovi]QID18994.1 NAD(P)-dependent oxidoreductase [Nitrogeniibacter mangrovi]
MKLGFIGLGDMGLSMARHLLRAGHEVAVWARRERSAESIIADGAGWCGTPAELARHCEIVITMVTASADVEDLALRADGLLAGFQPGAIHLDMSTIAPATARRLAARYAEAGVGWLDAPVSGGPKGALEASLAIMVGGDEATFTRCYPLLEILGGRIVRIGAAGAGQVAKACNQMIMVAAIEAGAEAMRLAAANGVDGAKVRAALMGGSAASKVLEVMGERMVTRNFERGVDARLHHKDFAILMGEAHQLGAPLPIAAIVWQQLNALMARGGAKWDTAALLTVLEAMSERRDASG